MTEPQAAAEMVLAPAPDWRTWSMTAKDGVELLVRSLGAGPPLVMVHGGMSQAVLYGAVAQALASEREVHLLERRNSGVSGAGPFPHDFAVEAQDVGLLIERLGGACDLFGHSAGALVALETAHRVRGVRRLALYEPPITAAGAGAAIALERFRVMRAADWRGALRQALLAVGGVPEAEVDPRVDLVASLPPAIVATLLDAVERQVEGLVAFPVDAARWATLSMPLLLIAGAESVEHPLQDSTRRLRRVLPQARYVELPGESHTANLTAPLGLARAIADFLR